MVGDDDCGVQVVFGREEATEASGVEVRRRSGESAVRGIEPGVGEQTMSGEDGKETAWTTCNVYDRRSKKSCPLHSSAGQTYKPARAHGRWAFALPL